MDNKAIKQSRGAAMVEFVLVAPLLFVLIFGIIEFATLLYNKAVITNASREASRYAATFYTNPSNAVAARPTCSEVKVYVATYVKAHLFDFTGSPAFSTDNVSCPGGIPYQHYSGYAGYVDTIDIQYQYNFLVFDKLLSLLDRDASMSHSLTLSARTTMRDENQN